MGCAPCVLYNSKLWAFGHRYVWEWRGWFRQGTTHISCDCHVLTKHSIFFLKKKKKKKKKKRRKQVSQWSGGDRWWNNSAGSSMIQDEGEQRLDIVLLDAKGKQRNSMSIQSIEYQLYSLSYNYTQLLSSSSFYIYLCKIHHPVSDGQTRVLLVFLAPTSQES